MKTILLSVLLSALMLTVSSTGTFAQKAGDEAAIQKILKEMSDAYGKRDLAGFARYFAQSPDLYYQVLTADGQLIMAQGWEAMNHMVGGHMKNDPDAFKGTHTLSDTKITIRGNTAWVHYTSHWNIPGQPGVSRDMLILEKQAANGSSPQWKIAALTTQNYAEGKLAVVK
jgi:ketosteroid isomerase-like protein